MNFLRFFVRQTVLVNLASAFLVVVGLWTALTLRREAFPAVSLDIVTVVTRYPGASPKEVEKLVTLPLERAIEAVDGLKQIDSVSVENLSTIIVQIDPDAEDKDRVVADLQRAVDRVTDLPEDADDPLLTEVSPYFPVLAVSVGTASRTDLELRTLAKDLQEALEDIDGVGQVAASGLRDEEIWVEVDPRRLEERAVSVAAVAEALRRRNVQLPGGRLTVGGKEVLVRTSEEFEGAEDLAEVVVRSNDEGAGVRVRDVATVTHRLAEARQIYRTDGKPAILLMVQKKKTGDSLNIAARAKELVERYRRDHPDYSFDVSDDSTFYIQRRLRVALSNAVIGFVLVLGVLFLLLSPYTALFTAAGMVVALLTGVLLAAAFGMTVNLLTLFGFVMVLGMLVDDSVVVAESVDTLQEKGKDPREDAVRGAARVASPVLSAVSTTIAAFLPLIFMSGILGKFMKFIPAVVVFCLAASVLEAFLILPNHLAHAHSWKVWRPFRAVVAFQRERIYPSFLRVQKAAVGFLEIFVRRPGRSAAAFGLLLAAVLLGGGSQLRFKLFPVDVEEFLLSWEMPVGTALEVTDAVGRRMEEIVRKLPAEEVDVALTTIGGKGEQDQFTRGSHLGQIRVVLTQPRERQRTGEAIKAAVREEAQKVPGPERVEVEGRRTGPPTGKPVAVVLMGEDVAVLEELSGKVQEALRGREGVVDVGDDLTEGKHEVHVKVDEALAARAGLSVEQVAAAVRGALDGLEATKIQRGTEEVVIRVRYEHRYTKDPKALEKVVVVTPFGHRIPLSRLAKFQEETGVLQILRRDGKRAIKVEADVDESKITAFEVNRWLEEEVLPNLFKDRPGFSYKVVGENEDTEESLESLKRLFLVALFLIYIILATQFSSFTQPFLIMFAIPLGMAGVVLVLLTHGLYVSLLALLGTVALSGVVVNNAILLVEFANRAIEEGKTALQAVLSAGEQRFRPIVITSFTTVAGLLPLGYGIGGEEPFLQPMALVLAWGVAVGSVLTYFAVPCLWMAWKKAVDPSARKGH